MEQPPAGINLHETQVPRILGVNIATFALAAIVICLRFLSRRLSRAQLWWDDWLMLPAITFAAVMCLVSITYMTQHGLGKHIWVGPADAAVVWAQGLFISELSYTAIICSIKFSVLAFYWRIFKQSQIRIPIYVLGTIVSCWGVAVFFITIFQCVPVSDFWDRFSPTYDHAPHCGVNVNQFFNGNSIPNILTDAAILILPIPFVWKLHLPQSQKLALSSIFLLGIFVVGVSIARFTFIINLDLKSPDITWNFVNVQIWTGVESHIGIVCACLPSLRPLLNLALFGSVERPSRVRGSNEKLSGSLSGKLSSVWSSHLPSFHFDTHRSSSSRDEDDSRAFVRAADDRFRAFNRTHVGVSDGSLNNAIKDGEIGVRTDVFVHNQV